MKIKVVDEIMSSGKSHWIMNQMNIWKFEDKFQQYVYLSPLLSEVGGELLLDENGKEIPNKYQDGRIQKQLPDLHFTYPVQVKGSKGHHIRSLLHQGRNISATHNLFLNLDSTVINSINQYNNILVIDECLDAYRVFDGITPKSLSAFISNETFLIDKKTNRMTYNHNVHPLNEMWEFKELADLCDTGCVYYVAGDVVVWEFPYEVLSAFNEVWVLTYLFEGSFMAAWCKINGVDIEYVNPQLKRTTSEVKSYIKDCIELVETRSMLRIQDYSYSQEWWKNKAVSDVVDKVRKCLESCIATTKSKSHQILITCPKLNWEHSDDKRIQKRILVRGKGFSKSTWLYSDARATNDYADKNTLIYLLGKNPNTVIYNFCHGKGIVVKRDLFALASFVQWVFRGSVRKQEKMYLIVPSKRMRDLFKLWLENNDEDLIKMME